MDPIRPLEINCIILWSKLIKRISIESGELFRIALKTGRLHSVRSVGKGGISNGRASVLLTEGARLQPQGLGDAGKRLLTVAT